MAPAVRPYTVRAGSSLTASLERSVHLFPAGAASVVDAGAFVASFERYRARIADHGTLATLEAISREG